MLRLSVALLALAGCAAPPPAAPPVDRPVLGTPDPRYIPPPPSGSRPAEGPALLAEAMRDPSRTRQIIRARAATNVGVRAAGETSRAHAARLQAEERRLETLIEQAIQADERRRRQEDATRRQTEYCEDYAHNLWVRSAPLSSLLAARVVGSPEYRAYYRDCMAAFRRVDRYMEAR